MDAARAARTPLPPPPLPQDYDDEPEYQPAPVHPLASLRGPAAAGRASSAAEQDYYEQPQYAEPSRSRTRRATTMRCMAGSRSGEHDYQRDPAYPDDPYAYQGELRGRARAEEALERPDDGRRGAGAGRGGDGRCLCLSHLCRFAPQRRAADHQGRQQPDQGGAGASPTLAPPRPPTACRRAMAAKSWCRARRRRSTSIPGPAGRAWCFRR